MSFDHFDRLFEDISVQLNIPYEDLQQALTRVFSRLSCNDIVPSSLIEQDMELTQILEEESKHLELPFYTTLSCYYYFKSLSTPITYNKIIDIINEKYHSQFITPSIIDHILKNDL